MGGYYLKTHYKSVGSYPDKAVHFPEGCGRLAREFACCDSFLLYETKKGDRPGLEGAGAIWGLGQPTGGVIPITGQKVSGRIFTMAVPIQVIKSLRDRTRGIPALRVREVVGRPLGFAGGIWNLTPDQFVLLRQELEGYIAQEESLGFNIGLFRGNGVSTMIC